MNFKPIRDRILVKPHEVENTTSGGIFIPDNAKEKPVRGTVLSVGSGHLSDDGTITPLEVSEGNTVMYTKGAGFTVEIDNQELLILNEEQVLAVVS